MTIKTRKLKGEDFFFCEECEKEKSDFYCYTDNFREQTICEICFNKRFAEELKAKHLEWFEKNFNKEDYPPTFWKQFEN